MLHFAVAGIDTWWWLPLLAGLVASFVCAVGGISGAVVLLPFQVSVLGFGGPAASATNLVFNLVATPGGVWRYAIEGRLLWPLAWVSIIGALPGLLLGWWLRVHWLLDPTRFRWFVAVVLALIAASLVRAAFAGKARKQAAGVNTCTASAPGEYGGWRLLGANLRNVRFEFAGQARRFSVPALLFWSFWVGALGGAYGVGGGSLLAPVCIALFRLPAHMVAGATLLSTFATSLAGVALYAGLPTPQGVTAQPDWALGALFGVGGLVGMNLGARAQKHLSQRHIQWLLAIVLAGVAARYAFAGG